MIRIGMIAGMAMLVAGAALAAPPEQQKPAQQLPGPPPPVTAGAPDIAPVSPSVYSTGTVAQFLNVCGNDQGGCADEVGTVLIDKMSFDGRSNICLPGPDYALPALQWLKTHPEAQSMPTEDGVFLALQKTYPCT